MSAPKKAHKMKICVETIGLPTLAKVIGRKVDMEFAGQTLGELISHIKSRYGKKASDILFNKKGELDETIQVILNDDGFIQREELLETRLKQGDVVRFILLAGGG